jgi:hypothetical protein
MKILDKITWEGAFDFKYVILTMIGLDKGSIYGHEWPEFIASLTEEDIEMHEKVLDIVFK